MKNQQIPRSVLGDNRQHLCSPGLSIRRHHSSRSDDDNPMCSGTTSLHIFDGKCAQTHIAASQSSTGLQIPDASTFRRSRLSARPRSPEHFIIVFGIIVHLGLMIVCVMSNAHYPNLLHSLSKEDFFVWKLVLTAAFL
jgi:hypothetical protein